MRKIKNELKNLQFKIFFLGFFLTGIIFSIYIYFGEINIIKSSQLEELRNVKFSTENFLSNIENQSKIFAKGYENHSISIKTATEIIPNIKTLIVLNKKGYVLDSYIQNGIKIKKGFDYSRIDIYKKMQLEKKSFWSNVFLSFFNEDSLVSYNLKYKDKFFIIVINLKEFSKTIIKKINKVNIGSIILFDANSYLLMDEDRKNLLKRRFNAANTDMYKKLINKLPKNNFTKIKNLNGKEIYATYEVIDKVGWKIVSFQNYSYIVKIILNTILLVFLTLFLAAVLAHIFFIRESKKIISSIGIFNEGFQELTDGKFKKLSSSKELNYYEFEKLGLKFNKMIRILDDSRRKNLQALEDFRILFNLTNESMCLVDENNLIKLANNSFKDIFLINDKDVCGDNLFKYLRKSGNEYVKNVIESKKKIVGLECELELKNESIISVIIDKKQIQFNNNTYSLIILIDITELKEKEKIVSQQTKLASMGEMINNIAHQWRQPLSVISVASSGIKIQSEMGNINREEMKVALNNIISSTQYLSKTLESFRTFFKENNKKEKFLVKKPIENALDILKTSITKNNIQIVKEYAQDIEIFSYEKDLLQIILNILNNSKDALIYKMDFNALKIIKIVVFEENNNIIINIVDNGGGIEEKYIDKVFEPYFTTKDSINSAGIGLYMARQIILNHLDGNIFIKNRKLKIEADVYDGVCVTIQLPKNKV